MIKYLAFAPQQNIAYGHRGHRVSNENCGYFLKLLNMRYKDIPKILATLQSKLEEHQQWLNKLVLKKIQILQLGIPWSLDSLA